MSLPLAWEIVDGIWTLGDAGVDYFFSRQGTRVLQEHGLRYIKRKAKEKFVEYGWESLKEKVRRLNDDEENKPRGKSQPMPANPQTVTRSGAGRDIPSSNTLDQGSRTMSQNQGGSSSAPDSTGGSIGAAEGGQAEGQNRDDPGTGFTSAAGYSGSKNHSINTVVFSKNMRHYLTYHEQKGWTDTSAAEGEGTFPAYDDIQMSNTDWVRIH